MRYTDRMGCGVEQYLFQNMTMLYGIDDVPSDELRERLEALPRQMPVMMVRLTELVLEQLREKSKEAYEYIPAEISRLFEKDKRLKGRSGRGQYVPNMDKFITWLCGLKVANEQDRVSRQAELSNFASRAGGGYSAVDSQVARGFLGLNNQRVMLRLERGGADEGDTVVFTSAERTWGQVFIRFKECSGFTGARFPLPGYVYSFEGTVAPDGGLHVDMLIDTSFSDVEQLDRLISDDNWVETGFDCRSFSVEPHFYDYAGRMARLGTPRFELIEDCASVIINKYELLGRSKEILSEGERAMLPAACFLSGGRGLLDRDSKESEDRFEALIYEALENRYAMRQFSELLERSGSAKLKKLLDQAIEKHEEDRQSDEKRLARSFYSVFEAEVSSGAARPLLALLAERMEGITSEYSGDIYRAAGERSLIEKIQAVTVPELEKLGFTGVYPNYSREGRKNIDMLTFLLDTHSEKPEKGRMTYFATIAAAQLPIKVCRRLEKLGVPQGGVNALDSMPEAHYVSDYGELAGMDDSQYIRIDVEMLAKEQRIVHDETARLPHYIGLAESQFRRGRIPRAYRAARRRSVTMRGSRVRSFAERLPVGVFAAIALLLVYRFWLKDQPFYNIGAGLSAAAAVAGGLIVSLISGALRRRRCSRKLWRY